MHLVARLADPSALADVVTKGLVSDAEARDLFAF